MFSKTYQNVLVLFLKLFIQTFVSCFAFGYNINVTDINHKNLDQLINYSNYDNNYGQRIVGGSDPTIASAMDRDSQTTVNRGQ